MEDRDLVACLATRATTSVSPRPDSLFRGVPQSSFVGEIEDVDIKRVLGVYGIASATPEMAGDAPAIRLAVHRLPGGAAAVIVGAADDDSDKIAEWVPIDSERGLSMLGRLRCSPDLNGRDIKALAVVMSHVSWFAHEASFVASLEAERVAVLEDGKGCVVVAAKARFGPV